MTGKIGSILLFFPLLLGFVFLSSHRPRMGASLENPMVTFFWDGSYPPLVGSEDPKNLMRNLITQALRAWETPKSYIKFNLILDETVNLNSKDHRHSIIVQKSGSLSSAASAHPTIENGIIVDCDITLEDRRTSPSALLQTLTHEIGHCLGLGHSHEHSKSLMSYARISGYKPSLDDLAGLIYLYPKTS